MSGVIINLSLAGLFVMLLVCTTILLVLLRGAPYVPSQKKTVDQMVAFAEVKPGERAIDLGSGDGRLVIALARSGAEAHGYEINPLLVWLGRREIRKAGLEKNAFIHWKDFWSVDFSNFNVVTVFGISHIMRVLKRKCQRELPAGARVVANSFPFPGWQHAKRKDEVFLYRL